MPRLAVVEANIEIPWDISEGSQKQRDLPAVMNVVDCGVMHHLRNEKSLLRPITEGRFHNPGRDPYREPPLELAHLPFDAVPLFRYGSKRWEAGSTEARPASGPVQPAPLGAHHVDQGVTYGTAAPGNRLSELFGRQLRDHFEEFSIGPIAVFEQGFQVHRVRNLLMMLRRLLAFGLAAASNGSNRIA